MSQALEPPRHLPTVGVVELSQWAGFQTRRDRKYLVPRDAVDELVAALPPARVLSIDGATSFRYESVYFDTDELTSYAAAAKRRPRRFKVRTRTYLASEQSMLEVKVRDPRGQTVKLRAPHSFDRRAELTSEAEEFLRTVPAVTAPAGDLHAALVTTYRRSTFMLEDQQARITVDTDLRWATTDGVELVLPGIAVIETKTAGRPSSYDGVLWRRGFRPSTLSKYCTGLAALRPALPANKWHRVLNRELLGGGR
jgi:hypothetical protein